MISLYAAPFLILLISIGFLFLDAKQPKLIIVAVILGLLGFSIAFVQIKSIGSQLDKNSMLSADIDALEQWKKSQLSYVTGILAQYRPQVADTGFQLEYFSTFGWNIKNEYLINALTADEARRNLIEMLPKNHFVTKPVMIKNLPDDIDQTIVTQALEEVGFSVELPMMDESTMTVETETKDEAMKDEMSKDEEKKIEPVTVKRVNVLYFGPYVKTHEIKLIALTMIRAGVNLKLIRVMRNAGSMDARTVVFDWSKSYRNRPPLDPIELYETKSFQR